MILSLFYHLFTSDRDKLVRDLSAIADLTSTSTANLVPLGKEELESLSAKITLDKVKRQNWTRYHTGRIQTIFHEDVALFGYRILKSDKVACLVRTNPFIYSYIVSSKEAQVFINGTILAYIKPDLTIYNRTGKSLIGRIDRSDPLNPELLIGDDHYGIFNRWPADPKQHDRVLQFVKTMPSGIHELFIAVTFYLMCANQWKAN